MPDAAIIVVVQENLAECGVHYSDAGFELHRDYVGALVVKPPPSASQPRVEANTLSDSTDPDWIRRTFKTRSSTAEATGPDISLSERETRFLTQVREDLGDLSEPVRLSASAKLCKLFTEDVGLKLARIPQARCAVFGDEEDGITLVAHSRASMRQVSFEFGDDEKTINIVSIDEQMHRFERGCGIDKTMTLAEAIAWLNPR